MKLKRSPIMNITLDHRQSGGIAQGWCPPALAKCIDPEKQLLLEFVQHFQQDD